jgi:type IV secretion system protein VirB8
MNIFKKGSSWEADRFVSMEKSRKIAWFFCGLFAFCFVIAAVALAKLAPLKRTIPYVVKQDGQTGNIEVLQTFDNRVIGNQELMNKYWARTYVTAREQYNWWLVGADYDRVSSFTEQAIFSEYANQFTGEKSLDKVFGDFTERRIKILSVTPSPTNPSIMVIRFERTTISRGVAVETPTVFVANLAFKYLNNQYGAEADLMRNPLGYQVYSYRRDVELPGTPIVPTSTITTPANTETRVQ